MPVFLLRAALVAVGLWISTDWVPGVEIDGPGTLLLAGLLLGVVNAIVRPIAIVVTLPATVLSLGLFILVINAAMVGCVAWMLPGMQVAGFWAALWTSVIVSIVGIAGSRLIRFSAPPAFSDR